jgi:murein DD-endopeptidase MepM/ murein hydrolase activator NlpD
MGVAAASFFAVVTAFGTVPEAPLPLVLLPIDRALNPRIETIAAPATAEYLHEDRFQRGDTLASMLDRLGIEELESQRLLSSREVASQLRWLRPGTTVQARISEDGAVQDLWFLSPKDRLVVISPHEGGYGASEQPVELTATAHMKSGEIRSSLFAATDNANIPDAVAIQLAEVFAGDIDFHRDLRKGDRFTVVYEMLTHQGRQIRSGRLLAAEFVNQQRTYRAVWFQEPGTKGGYYTPEGKNLRKAFLRSPLEFSRVTSGFSLRFHPILKQWRAHKGVDYGAPTGTQVKATGDGVIDFVGRQSGYGNLVVVRHGNGMTTWYAHLNSFARGLKTGTRVAQGEVIGAVGQTGWATGPHLHYEFRVNNEHRNPLTIALPAAEPITPERIAAFRAVTAQLAERLDLLRGTNLALLE